MLKVFWSSVDLTGNQTEFASMYRDKMFWSSVDLTGNQTATGIAAAYSGFGAVSI